VDQLHASNLNYAQRKQTEIIQKSIQHILNIVNDILDFSKLNAGKLELNKKGFELRKTIHQTTELLEPLITEKNIALVQTIDEQVPEILIGDAYRIRQILFNIIGNAIKYTIEGSINVSVSYKNINMNACEIILEVKDTGIGINKTELENIFKEFHMADNAEGWNKAGSSGLGLSITKMLVELHNGRIDIESELNKGTTVRIRIPFVMGTAGDLKTDSSYLNDLLFLENKKIIIADDELFNRVLMNNILHKYNAQTFEAENGLHVLSILENESIDCILMDVKMPLLNGIQTTTRIRQLSDASKANVPIIAVTAAMTHDNLKIFIDNKVDLFMEKPFKENDLLDLLYKTIKTDQVYQGNISTVLQQETLSNNKKLFDLSELQRQSGKDPQFISDMLETLIISTQRGIAEIEQELQNERWDNINLIAHRLASPFRFIMAADTYNSIKQIENMTESELSISKAEILNQFQNFKNHYSKLETLLNEYKQSPKQ
jgi:CheY-like chemotaxis protein/two-component sensor histidine kinase